MILIGIGANLPSEAAGPPAATCAAALDRLDGSGAAVVKHSRWFRSRAYPPSGQPDFVNGVAQLSTTLSPSALLTRLHDVERQFGRRRNLPNAARPIDLDLLDYEGLVQQGGDGPALPHPRLHERAFVLLPLADVAPLWRHPVLDVLVAELIRRLPASQAAAPIDD